MQHDDIAYSGRHGWWGPQVLLGQSGSLTAALRRRLAAEISVELLACRWVRLGGMQARALGLAPGSIALHREVFLCRGGRRVLFARSTFPLACLRGRGRALKSLGRRPLGDVLYAGRAWSATVRRHRLVQVRLKWGHEDHRALRAWNGACSYSAPLWGRRSILMVGTTPIAIREYLLADAAYPARIPAT